MPAGEDKEERERRREEGEQERRGGGEEGCEESAVCDTNCMTKWQMCTIDRMGFEDAHTHSTWCKCSVAEWGVAKPHKGVIPILH